MAHEIAQPEFQLLQAGYNLRFAIKRAFGFLQRSASERRFVGFFLNLLSCFRSAPASFLQPFRGPRGSGCYVVTGCRLVGDEKEQTKRVLAGKFTTRTTALERRFV